jgi:hypothetical protein
MLITFKSSESSKEVHPGSIEAFAELLFVAIASVESGTLSFSRLSLHHGQFFRPLSPIIIGVTTVRRHDATTVRRHDATPPCFSATVLTTPRPHGLTLLSSVLSTPDTQMVKRPLQPHSSLKRGSPCPKPPQLNIITALVLPPASLGHLATRASLPSIRSSPSKLLLRLCPRRQEEARK